MPLCTAYILIYLTDSSKSTQVHIALKLPKLSKFCHDLQGPEKAIDSIYLLNIDVMLRTCYERVDRQMTKNNESFFTKGLVVLLNYWHCTCVKYGSCVGSGQTLISITKNR